MCMSCFVIIKSILFNLLCVWVLSNRLVASVCTLMSGSQAQILKWKLWALFVCVCFWRCIGGAFNFPSWLMQMMFASSSLKIKNKKRVTCAIIAYIIMKFWTVLQVYQWGGGKVTPQKLEIFTREKSPIQVWSMCLMLQCNMCSF